MLDYDKEAKSWEYKKAMKKAKKNRLEFIKLAKEYGEKNNIECKCIADKVTLYTRYMIDEIENVLANGNYEQSLINLPEYKRKKPILLEFVTRMTKHLRGSYHEVPKLSNPITTAQYLILFGTRVIHLPFVTQSVIKDTLHQVGAHWQYSGLLNYLHETGFSHEIDEDHPVGLYGGNIWEQRLNTSYS